MAYRSRLASGKQCGNQCPIHHAWLPRKITKHSKRQTPPPQFEDREQALEPDMADMAGILELSHQQLKKSIINMLRALIKKVAGMQEQIGNVSREMEIPRKNQNKC